MFANMVVIGLFSAAMFVFAYLEIASYRRTPRDFRSLIVSLGLLGTFTGILIGLWDFDPRAIRESVPLLLEGLKTAFITSVEGMALSIGLGVYERLALPENRTGIAEESEPERREDDISALLQVLIRETAQLRTELQAQSQRQHTQLLGQLREGFASVESQLSDSGSQAVIEALRTTMAEFNEHLVESFGENFKALDSAIGQMVRWQKEHRESVERFEQALSRTTEAARSASEALLEVFQSASVEYRAAFEALSASLQQSADKNLETIRAAASEVYRNFDELIKVQQHLDTMTRNYERMAEVAERLERSGGKPEG